MPRFALIDTVSIDGREPGPGDIHEWRSTWCTCCQSEREDDGYELGPCAHEQLAADIPRAELRLDRELSRALSRARIQAEAMALLSKEDGR